MFNLKSPQIFNLVGQWKTHSGCKLTEFSQPWKVLSVTTCINTILECLIPFKHGHFELIDAHSKRLEEFDKLTRGALETRKLQYEEWEDWKSKPAPLASGRLLARSSISVALTDRKMVAAYDRTGQRRT